MAYTSPFSAPEAAMRALETNPAYRAIASLASSREVDNRFCLHHLTSTSHSAHSDFIRHRRLLSALLLPLLHKHAHATSLAAHSLSLHHSQSPPSLKITGACTPLPTARPRSSRRRQQPTSTSTTKRTPTPDLERAFRGPARSAYSWLTALLSTPNPEERTFFTLLSHGGCPACLISRILESEPLIRLILVSARLAPKFGADLLRDTGISVAGKEPDLKFWEESVKQAVLEEDFYERDWSEICERVASLEEEIWALEWQCEGLMEEITAASKSEPCEERCSSFCSSARSAAAKTVTGNSTSKTKSLPQPSISLSLSSSPAQSQSHSPSTPISQSSKRHLTLLEAQYSLKTQLNHRKHGHSHVHPQTHSRAQSRDRTPSGPSLKITRAAMIIARDGERVRMRSMTT